MGSAFHQNFWTISNDKDGVSLATSNAMVLKARCPLNQQQILSPVESEIPGMGSSICVLTSSVDGLDVCSLEDRCWNGKQWVQLTDMSPFTPDLPCLTPPFLSLLPCQICFQIIFSLKLSTSLCGVSVSKSLLDKSGSAESCRHPSPAPPSLALRNPLCCFPPRSLRLCDTVLPVLLNHNKSSQ